MGRSAKVTRCVGLRQMKNSRKGITKIDISKDRRRKEKAERIRQTLEEEAEERRQQRKKSVEKRHADDAKTEAGVKPTQKGFFSLGAAADALCKSNSHGLPRSGYCGHTLCDAMCCVGVCS